MSSCAVRFAAQEWEAFMGALRWINRLTKQAKHPIDWIVIYPAGR